MRTRPHVVPVGGDEPRHVVAACCWCQPFVDTQDDMVVHHAKDLREARERHGCPRPGEEWVVVEEALTC